MRVNYIYGDLKFWEHDGQLKNEDPKTINKTKFSPINHGYFFLRSATDIFSIKHYEYVYKNREDEISIKINYKKEKHFAKLFANSVIIKEYHDCLRFDKKINMQLLKIIDYYLKMYRKDKC